MVAYPLSSQEIVSFARATEVEKKQEVTRYLNGIPTMAPFLSSFGSSRTRVGNFHHFGSIHHPFGLDWRWFQQMKSKAVIQVRWQPPEVQQLLLQGCQGGPVRHQLACRLDYYQADPLERFE
jgi:hypothetical protein